MKQIKIEKVFFTYNEKKIGGFLYTPTGKGPFPTVILVHGFGGGTHEEKNKFMCTELAKNGILAFMFDFYDTPHGLSEIPIEETTVSLQLKVLHHAVDFVCTVLVVDKNKIGLTGHSLGGMTVILYTPNDSRIKALVVQSALSDFGKSRSTTFDNHEEWKEKGYKIFDKSFGPMRINYSFIEDGLQHDVYSAMNRIKIPIMIFHGDKEESVSTEQARKQAQHLKKTDKLVIIPGADHSYKVNNTLPIATKLLVDFMKEKLNS